MASELRGGVHGYAQGRSVKGRDSKNELRRGELEGRERREGHIE